MDTSVEKRGRQYMYWLFDSILMAALVRVCCCTACSIQDVIALEGAFSHVNCCSSSAITTSIIYIYADAIVRLVTSTRPRSLVFSRLCHRGHHMVAYLGTPACTSS